MTKAIGPGPDPNQMKYKVILKPGINKLCRATRSEHDKTFAHIPFEMAHSVRLLRVNGLC